MRLEAAAASKQQLTSEKETKLLQERGRRLEAEIAGLKSDIEKGLSWYKKAGYPLHQLIATICCHRRNFFRKQTNRDDF